MNKIIFTIGFLFICLSHSLYAQESDEFAGFSNGEIICSDNVKMLGAKFRSSSEAYDPYVVGIFSRDNDAARNPNIVKVPVVNSGICLVKYNNQNGPIQKGDPLTSSSVPGVAMKATKSGMIIGIALEDASASTGMIKTRVVIQYSK
jgi:hypothetical protein